MSLKKFELLLRGIDSTVQETLYARRKSIVIEASQGGIGDSSSGPTFVDGDTDWKRNLGEFKVEKALNELENASKNADPFVPTTVTLKNTAQHGAGVYQAYNGCCLLEDACNVYLAPYEASYAQLFNSKTEKLIKLRSPMPEKESHAGSVLLPGNNVALVPFRSPVVRIHHVETDTVTEIPLNGIGKKDPDAPLTGGLFHGGCLSTSGKVALSAWFSNSCYLVDPNTGHFDQIDTLKSIGTRDYFGCCITPDNRICFPPHRQSKFLLYDERSGKNTVNMQIPAGNSSGGCCCMLDGRMFISPCTSKNAYVFDPKMNSLTIAGQPGIFEKGVTGGASSYFGTCLTPQGHCFLSPFNATRGIVYDPKNDKFDEIILSKLSGSAFVGCCLTCTGKIVCAPYNASIVGVFECGDWSPQSKPSKEILSSPLFNKGSYYRR